MTSLDLLKHGANKLDDEEFEESMYSTEDEDEN